MIDLPDMRRLFRRTRCLAALSVAAAAAGGGRATAQAFDTEALKAGVVAVRTTRDAHVPPDHQGNWLTLEQGTGFVIAQRADSVDILTARHVIADNEKVDVYFYSDQSKPVPALVVPDTSSPEMALDFAILRVTFPAGQSPVPTLHPYRFAPPSSLRDIDPVFTLNFGWDSVDNKVVNMKVPHHAGWFKYSKGSTGEGFSGGPVFDAQGRLVGMHINSTAEGGMFAMADRIGAVLEELATTTYPVAAMNELLPIGADAPSPTAKPPAVAEKGAKSNPAAMPSATQAKTAQSSSDGQKRVTPPSGSQTDGSADSPPSGPSRSKRILAEAEQVGVYGLGTVSRRGIAWNPDGTKIAVWQGEQRTFAILDMSTKEAVTNRYLQPLDNPLAWIEWRKAGLFAGSPDSSDPDRNGEMFFYSAPAFPLPKANLTLGKINGWSSNLAGDRTAYRYVYLGISHIRVVDASGTAVSAEIEDRTDTMALSPDGQHLASGRLDPKVWDVTTGKKIWEAPEGHNDADSIIRMEWSADGAFLATSNANYGFVKVWDARTGKLLLETPSHNSQVVSIGWSPDGHRLATSDESGQAFIIGVPAGTLLMKFQAPENTDGSRYALQVAWNPSGSRLGLAWRAGTAVYDVGDY